MLLTIEHLLDPEERQSLLSALKTAEFVDGKLTAGWYAKSVKHNQQLQGDKSKTRPLKRIVQTALERNALFQAAVRPKAVHSLLFSRYDRGMSYGRHADNALMGQWRSDVSFTLFLNEPTAYEGGELVVEGAQDERAYKLEAGSLLAYPSSTLHRVEEVSRGTRFVCVGWVQSWVRDPQERELLFDLETVRRSLFARDRKSDEFDLLSKSIANLLRKWAD